MDGEVTKGHTGVTKGHTEVTETGEVKIASWRQMIL